MCKCLVCKGEDSCIIELQDVKKSDNVIFIGRNYAIIECRNHKNIKRRDRDV